MPQNPPDLGKRLETMPKSIAPGTKPDEARMSEIAKRLLSTPPDRQSVGKALAPKKQNAWEGERSPA